MPGAEITPRWMVLGATGAIGRFLLEDLRARGATVLAVSRAPPAPDDDTLRWLRADLQSTLPLNEAEFLVSAGPLDALANLLTRAPDCLRCRRLVAFSSTSASVKSDSADAHERDLAARLRQAEQSLAQWCSARGTELVVLRPTLVYGAAMDQHLTRLARVALRLGFLPLPGSCRGLRQPVHAQDLARVAIAAALQSGPVAGSYTLAGGETLSFHAMVQRMLATLSGTPPLVRVPPPLFRAAYAVARALKPAWGPGFAALARLEQDLVFDDSAARARLHWSPRSFAVERDMFMRG